MNSSTEKRGLSYREAMDYVGVKRRTFDAVWRPQLVAMPQGSSLIFDRQDLDRLFEQFKNEAAGAAPHAANDEQTSALAHTPRGNGRPIVNKGGFTWANQRGASTPTAASGKSTSGIGSSAFASAVSRVSKTRNAG